MGPAVRYLFKFNEEVIGELQLARDTLGLTGPYTALHVRTGFVGMAHKEHSNLSKLKHSSSQWAASYHCAVSTADRSLGKNSLIYLATDSDKVKDLAIHIYPHRFRTLNNALVHVDKLPHLKQASDSLETNEEEGILVVWIELFLLAQANTIVRGGSGYSWIAGHLCGLKNDKKNNIWHC